MTWADGIILGILLVSGMLAFARGLTQELMSLAAWVAAAVLAILAFPMAAPAVYEIAGRQMLTNLALAVTLFAVIAVPLSFVAHWLTGKLRGEDTGLVDQSLGFLFGLARGLVLVGAAYWGALVLSEGRTPGWMAQARLEPLVTATTQGLVSLLPPEMAPARSEAPDESDGGDGAAPGTPDGAAPGYRLRDRRALDRLISTASEGADEPEREPESERDEP